jgi:hypothetical protein
MIGAVLAAGMVAAAYLPPGSARMLNVNELLGLSAPGQPR